MSPEVEETPRAAEDWRRLSARARQAIALGDLEALQEAIEGRARLLERLAAGAREGSGEILQALAREEAGLVAAAEELRDAVGGELESIRGARGKLRARSAETPAPRIASCRA